MSNLDRITRHQAVQIRRQDAAASEFLPSVGTFVSVPGFWKPAMLRSTSNNLVSLEMESEAGNKIGGRTQVLRLVKPNVKVIITDLRKLYGENLVYSQGQAVDARVHEAKQAVDAEKAEKHSLAESQAVVAAQEDAYVAHCNSLTQEQAEKQTLTAFEYWLHHARSPIAGLKMVEFQSWPSNQFFNAGQMELAIKAHSKYRVPKQADFDNVHAMLLDSNFYVMSPVVKRSLAHLKPAPYTPPLQQSVSEDDITFALRALPKGVPITPEVAAQCNISRQVYEVLKARFAQANAARPQDLKAAATAGRKVNDNRTFLG
jgi:hypothetical protein